MRSRERGFTWAALALVATGVLFAALAAWALVERSAIPTELNGTVTTLELRHEKHPGVDDVWMVSIDDGDHRHVDTDVAVHLSEGARVQKDAWDSTLVIDGSAHQVELSKDAHAMLVLAPVLAVVISALTLWTHLRTRALRHAAQ